MRGVRKESATLKVLLALVPYTRENLQLTFHPDQFFNELERSSKYTKHTIREAYYRAKKNNLISIENTSVRLTSKGRRIVQSFVATKLAGKAELMVIFDIPESSANVRRELRSLLIELKFRQIQRSVWTTDMDHRSILRETVEELNAHDWVKIYEAASLN